MYTIIEYLNQNFGAIQSITTIVLVIITGLYVILTRKLAVVAQQQLAIQQPSVLAYVDTHERLPVVKVTNTGRATAYEVLININWPKPPQGVDGKAKGVESPNYGKLSPDDIIAFKSPHKIDVKRHFDKSTEYKVVVRIMYHLVAGGSPQEVEYVLDYAKHIRRMRSSRQAQRN